MSFGSLLQNNAQLVSGQGPGTTTGLTRLLCLNSQYLQPFVPSHPPLHMCPTPGPLAKWQAHAPVIERCWQGATCWWPSRLQLCTGAGSWCSHLGCDGGINKLLLSVHCFQTKGEEETLVSMEQRTGTPSVQEEERGRADQVTADTTITDNCS